MKCNFNRREFLRGAGAFLGLGLAARGTVAREWRAPRFAANPFALGVASGDPAPDGFVLWTRLVRDPLNGGGMPAEAVQVVWEVAADERFKKIVKRGAETALPEWGHSVHAEIAGLKPARPYWYRFRVGNEESPVARTRTTPARGANIARLKFAFVSCQHYDYYYTAHRDLARQDVDVVFHLGDYIYEGGVNRGGERPRQHNGNEIFTLDDYRNRYALYKLDKDLQAAHHAAPWIVTWDDHEVSNNYAGAISQTASVSREDFLKRRAIAYQVYYENMPLRRSSLPQGPDLRLYRHFEWGALAGFSVLDTRQYRTDQPCGDGLKMPCPEALADTATLTGAAQEAWLKDNLQRSRARWNVVPQQVMMAPVDYLPGPGERLSMDQWSGYQAQRNRLLRFVRDAKVKNFVVLTGDIHSNWAADLKADFADEKAPAVGAEFVGTSISSSGDGSDTRLETPAVLANNPHIRFYNNQRGYVLCRLTPDKWESDYRIVEKVTTPDAPVKTRATLLVENGKPGIKNV
jgi:alkaline phosphatase D